LVALTASISIIAGCGGASVSTGTKVVVLSGGVTTTKKTDTPAVPASTGTGTPTTYTSTIGGVSKTISIAASPDAFPAGTPIAVIPDQTPLFSGSLVGRAPGDISIFGLTSSGVVAVSTTFAAALSTVNGNIVLNRPIGLVPGIYYASIEGPVNFTGNGGATLTVGRIDLYFNVNSAGDCSMPTTISGSLPSNGTSTAAAGIQVTAKGVNLAGGSSTLVLSYTGGTKQQSGTYDSSSQITYKSLGDGFTVPTNGLTGLQFYSRFPKTSS
jgi:hypothetical protein